MDIFLAPRQGGKTTHLIEWLREAPEGVARVIISPTAQEAMRLYRSTMSDVLKGEPPYAESWQFISWQDAVTPRALAGVHASQRFESFEFALDNADLILQMLLGRTDRTLKRVTWNSDGLRVRDDGIKTSAIQTVLLSDSNPELTTHYLED